MLRYHQGAPPFGVLCLSCALMMGFFFEGAMQAGHGKRGLNLPPLCAARWLLPPLLVH